MREFLHWLAMGEYGLYLWSSYSLAAAVLIFHVISMKKQKKATMRQLRQWFDG